MPKPKRLVGALRAATNLLGLIMDHFLLEIPYTNRFFEIPSTAGFQKNDFGVSSTLVAGNTKIVFIMRIAVYDTNCYTLYQIKSKIRMVD